ncbi:MAG TPA: hypothetical protein PKW07_03740 [Syntrophorhabdaceae bacterium]|nr:hypothetical protein [Syntrophorhabdaceae bacterium]
MKFKRLSWVILIGVFIGFMSFIPHAFAAPPDNFTAIMVTEGIQTPMAKMGNKTRIENVGMKDIVTIANGDTKKSITLNINKKIYYEESIKQQDGIMPYYETDMVVDKKKMGTERIDGHPCNKYDVVYYRKSNPKDKFKAIIWEATDLKDFPIKMEFAGPQGKTTIMYKDIKIGAAKASMFEVPKGYKKVNSVQEVMGIGMGMGMKEMEEIMKNMQKGQRQQR